MYHDISRRQAARRRALVPILAAVLVLVLAGGWFLAGRVRADLDDQAEQALKAAVLAGAVQCYAVEGQYPPGLAYLEETYGLQINHEKYIVTYTAFASNLLPEVQVLRR